jgi:hypothetical protein
MTPSPRLAAKQRHVAVNGAPIAVYNTDCPISDAKLTATAIRKMTANCRVTVRFIGQLSCTIDEHPGCPEADPTR